MPRRGGSNDDSETPEPAKLMFLRSKIMIFENSPFLFELRQFLVGFGWFLRQRSDFLDPQERAVDSPGALGASLEHLLNAL